MIIADRAFVCEVLRRYREAREQMFVLPDVAWRSFWNGRVDALNEMYTELKGRGYADKTSVKKKRKVV